MPALVDGLPEILVGGQTLHAPVRWVHVSDNADVARLLVGGELLLSTGRGWPQDPRELSAFIASLVDAGLSGLVLELGSHYRYVPAVVVAAAEGHGLALVALNREVRFVTITEAVHSLIISEQTSALLARDEVHDLFTALSLRGSPADYIVHQLGRALRSTVVLENLAHEVVAVDVDRPGEESVLSGWEARSRTAHRAHAARGERSEAAGPGDWLIVPVEARGVRWGSLIALPGPSHPAGRTNVLQQGAIALALGRLADGDGDEWVRLGHQRLVDSLLGGRFSGYSDAGARLEAAGLPVGGRNLVGLVLTGAGPHATEAVAPALRGIGGQAVTGTHDEVLVALVSLPRTSRFDDTTVIAVARDVASATRVPPEGVVVHVGTPAEDVPGLLSAVHEALVLSHGRADPRARGPVVRRTDDRPLLRLVTSLRDDHRLQRHSEQVLAPLIEYDLTKGGDLLVVLASALAHPGNRTAAAAASHLSRSVFYQRLGLISDLLEADLDDGETLTALHLALLTRSVTPVPARRGRAAVPR